MSANSPDELKRLYEERFGPALEYRRAVWRVLIDHFFQRFISPEATVLDLGCGYGEFINQIRCGKRYAMDLNPDAPRRLNADVKCLLQDCAADWPLPDASLDVVFTSNFFEHLPDKRALEATVTQARRCLKPGGKLIAMGPNIGCLPGKYWDFWDHHLPLTEKSLVELLRSRDYEVKDCHARFLPYSMAGQRRYPMWMLKCYLKAPLAWRFFGRQFLVVAVRPDEPRAT